MSKQFFLIIFSTAFVAVLSGCTQGKVDVTGVITGKQAVETKQQAESDIAAIKAKQLFQLKLAEGVDMSSGPCLSDELMPGWVADVAHDPRLPMDNLPENQCSAFREGKASHFVEMDVRGEVIKVY